MTNDVPARYPASSRGDAASPLVRANLRTVLDSGRGDRVWTLEALAGLLIAKWAGCEVAPGLRAEDEPAESHARALVQAVRERNAAAGYAVRLPLIAAAQKIPKIYHGILDWLRPLDLGTVAGRGLAAVAFDDAVRFVAHRSGEDTGAYTPERIVDLMVELASPEPGESVYDPCFGCGGLLAAAARRLGVVSPFGDEPAVAIFGIEIKPSAYVVGLCRLLLAGIERPGLACDDALHPDEYEPLDPTLSSQWEQGFDCILAAPPWGRDPDFPDHHYYDHFRFASDHREDLFLEHVMGHLRTGGRAVVAVPEGMLFRAESSHLRKALLSDYRVDAVVVLPAGAFAPFTSIPMSLVAFSRAEPRSTVRFASVSPTAWWTAPDGVPGHDDVQRVDDGFASNYQDGLEVDAAVRFGRGGTHSGRLYRGRLFRSISDLMGGRRELSAGALPQGVAAWEVPIRELAFRGYELFAKKSGSDELSAELERLAVAHRSLEVARLSQVAEVQGGLPYDDAADTVDLDPSECAAGVLLAKDVTDEGVRLPSLYLDDEQTGRASESEFFRSGDLVVTTAGTVGTIGFIEEVAGKVGMVAGKSVALVRARGGLRPQFLAALLRSPIYRNWLSGHARGATIQHLSVDALRTVEIPVPPEAVQDAVLVELSGPRADALAVLSRLLSGTTKHPVSVWLETPIPARLVSGVTGGNHDGMDTLAAAAAGLRSISETLELATDDRSISAWLETAQTAAAALDDVAAIPFGSGRLAIFEFAQVQFHEALHKLDGAKGRPVERLRSFTGAMIKLAKRESQAMQDTITLDIDVEPAEVEVGITSEVRLRVTNASPVPLRNVRIMARQPDGTVEEGEVVYLGERSTYEIPLAVLAQDEAQPVRVAVSWQARRLDATAVPPGEAEVSLFVRSAGEGPRGDLGYSPYIVGSPVERREMFFGRTDVMEQITRQLGASTHANVILLEGNRRTGKTSILRQLENEDALQNWIPVDCSLQAGRGDDTDDEKKVGIPTHDFFRLIARKTGSKLYASGIETWFPDLPARDPQQPFRKAFRTALNQAFADAEYSFETFEHYLEAAINAANPRRILLMFDEFDALEEGIEAGVTSPQVPLNIRYLLQKYQRGLCAIIVGSRRLKKLRENYWSALFGLGYRVGISALSNDDAMRLVAEPVAGRLRYLPQACERLVELCACHPFLIQSLCSRVFDRALKGNDRAITRDIVEHAATEMVRDNEHFRTLWDQAGTERRRLLLALCDRLAEGPDAVSLGLLEVKLHEIRVPIRGAKELADDIAELRELELLEFDDSYRGGTYRLCVPLMAKWLQQNVDFDDLVVRAREEARI